MFRLLCLATVLAGSSLSFAAEDKPDNGTDPTRLSRFGSLAYEYLELREGFRQNSILFRYAQPVTKDERTNVQLKVPLVDIDVMGSGFGLGDISLKTNKVLSLTPQVGTIANLEWVFPTADRADRGTGKHVAKLGYTYALFLERGIFAPSLLHSQSLFGDTDRRTVSSTTLDLYYVPKLPDPTLFATLDPYLTYDWENEKSFFGLAVTVGKILGPAMGGSSQVYVKPSILFGNDRPFNWGFEIGYKVIGF